MRVTLHFNQIHKVQAYGLLKSHLKLHLPEPLYLSYSTCATQRLCFVQVLHGSFCQTKGQSNVQNLANQLQLALGEALDPGFEPAFLLQSFEVSQTEASIDKAATNIA